MVAEYSHGYRAELVTSEEVTELLGDPTHWGKSPGDIERDEEVESRNS